MEASDAFAGASVSADGPTEHDGPGNSSAVATTAQTSLAARMKARRDELADRTTEIFPLPLYGEVLAVELHPVEWEETQDIIMKRGQRSATPTSSQTSQTMAEELVLATVAFWEIKSGGAAVERISDVGSWEELAVAFTEFEAPDGPPEVVDRVALRTMIGSQGVATLSASFRMWMGGANTGIGKAVRRDF